MKRFIILTAAILFFAMSCTAGGKKEAVTFQSLPVAGQQLLKDHFSAWKISYVVKETELLKVEYEVRLDAGQEIELDQDGVWKKIDCGRMAVPDALVPAEIAAGVKQSFPDARIVEIEKDRRGYDVELDNGLDLKFDQKFTMRIDD